MSDERRAPIEVLSNGMPKLAKAAEGKPVPVCEHGTYCLSVAMRCRRCYPTPESFLQRRQKDICQCEDFDTRDGVHCAACGLPI